MNLPTWPEPANPADEPTWLVRVRADDPDPRIVLKINTRRLAEERRIRWENDRIRRMGR